MISGIEIQNVVVVASLGKKIDPFAIMELFGNVEYQPNKSPGLIFRLKQPNTTIRVFRSGRMVCTGAKSEEQACSAVMKVVGELRSKGINLKEPELFITNIVASANLGGRINLEAAVGALNNVMYEIDKFPGLIYKMDDPNVEILLFVSGNIVITGGKSEDEIREALDKICRILRDKELIFRAG